MGDAEALPDARQALELLGHDNWRERKQGVAALVQVMEGLEPRSGTYRSLYDRLLDGMVASEAVHEKAACHEVLVELGDACLDLLLARLSGPREQLDRLLVDLLGEVGNEEQADLLVAWVGDETLDPNLRASAATALGRIGGHSAEAALRRLLSDDLEMLRTYALDALRSSDGAVPVELLRPLLKDPVTRKGAAALLGFNGTVDAMASLIPLLDDPLPGVRAIAVTGLVRVHDALAASGKSEMLRAAVTQVPPRTLAHIRESILHSEPAVRVAGIRLATVAGDAEAVPLLLEVMDDPTVLEQAMAMVESLGHAANSALAQAASEVDAGKREHLFRLLGALRVEVVDPRLLTLLTEGLEDSSEEAACAAAEALKFVGARSCMGGLYRAMGTEGPLGELAADALAEIVTRVGGARQDDLKLLVGTSWPHQGALAQNLCRVVGKLGSLEYVPQLVSTLGSIDVGVRVAAAQALGMLIGEHEGVGALSFALTDEAAQVRAAVCRSLGLLGAPQSAQALLSATADPSPLVRAAAVQALVALDNPIAVARFREIVLEDPVPTVVVHAIEGLGSSGLDQDLTMLMSLCMSEDHEVVKAAARALTDFHAHRATAALLGLLSHERWDVRRSAAEVLAGRGDGTALEPLQRVLQIETDELVLQVVRDAVEKLSALSGVGKRG